MELDRLFDLEPEADPKPCDHRSKWCRPMGEGNPDHPDPTLCKAWRCRCGQIVIKLHR